MNSNRLLRLILLLFPILLLSVGLAAAAPATISNWCDADPTGNSACSSNVDKPAWLNPGYRWHVFFNTDGRKLCMQYSQDGGTNWTQTTCQFVGDNSTYEDCGDDNSGNGNCRNDHWICGISSNIASTNNIKFQFYQDPGNCDSDFTDAGEWSSQPTFSTGPNAVSLSSFSARQAAGGLAMAAAALVGLGGVAAAAVWRRR